MDNFIGTIYATLADNGIDTSNMTFDEVLEKYNEIADETVTLEEATDEAVEEIESAEVSQLAEEEAVEEETEENPQGDVEQELEQEEIDNDKLSEVIAQNKELVVNFLKEQGLL